MNNTNHVDVWRESFLERISSKCKVSEVGACLMNSRNTKASVARIECMPARAEGAEVLKAVGPLPF